MKKALPLFLFSLLCMMFSCKEDDLEPHKHEHGEQMTKQKVSFRQMKSYLLEHNTSSLLPASLNSSSNKGDDAFITAVDTTNITQIINGDVTTFTMHVNTVDDELYAYSNLVIKLHNGQTEELVLHYNPTAEWQAAFDAGERLPYEGSLTVTDIQGEGKMTGCMIEVSIACYGDSCPCTDGSGQVFYISVPCGGGDDEGGNPTDPDPGGHDPEGGGGGEGNNNSPNSCQSLKNKLSEPLQNGKNFKTRLEELKLKVFDSQDEWGYVNQNPNENPNVNSDSTNQYNPARAKTLKDGKKAVVFDISGPHIFGYMHTHPDNETTAGIHSGADILEFLRMVKYRYEMGYPTDNVYGIVVGNHGIYALKIDNIDDFIAGYGSYNGTSKRDFIKKSNREYKKIVENRTTSENNQEDNEEALLNFLDIIKFDTGISVYRAKDNLDGWEKLELKSNGEVNPINCN